jgi:hypothetical protein
MNLNRLKPWLVQLYPAGWREHYGEEFTALLEECLYTPLEVLDVILGAVDANLQLLFGVELNWRVMNMLNKIRTAILIVFAAYVAFVIAGLSLVGMADDSPMAQLMKIDPGLKAAWVTIQVGALVALLAVIIGGLPLARAVVRRALTGSHRNLPLLFVPLVAFLLVVAYLALIWAVGTGRIQIAGVERVVQPGAFPAGNRWMMAGLMIVFILGAIASVLAVWRVVSHTTVKAATFHLFGHPTTIQVYRFAYLPAVITTLAMLGMWIATLAWGWISFTSLPGVLAGNYGPWGMNTQAWFYGIVLLMTLATLTAGLGVLRGRPARRTG